MTLLQRNVSVFQGGQMTPLALACGRSWRWRSSLYCTVSFETLSFATADSQSSAQDLNTVSKYVPFLCPRQIRWGVLSVDGQWCGLRPSVLGQDRSQSKKKSALVLVLCCETRSCYDRRHNDLEGHSKFSSTIYSFSILYLEHHYRGDQQWRLLT